MTLPTHLWDIKEQIKEHAISYGLDPFETIYEMIDYEKMNEVASYQGFPTRYPHWRFGMEYERLAKSYSWGLHKIYELVINNNPCYAYLLEGNSLVEQKMVMAHVYGHSDFFKNNMWFSMTNRRMIDQMANNGSKVRRYQEKHGVEAVEEFLDVCLSLDNLIDYHRAFVRRKATDAQDEDNGEIAKIRAKSYMDSYINPKEFLAEQQQKKEDAISQAEKIPEKPEKDILLFLLEHAPMKPWQRNILSIVRDEAYYFAPQGQTKIINEGWASYWHSTIMTQKVLNDSEILEFADCHAGTVAMSPGSLNPYKIGLELFRDIEERWNQGRFGKAFNECENMEEKLHWNLALNQGREKIFEIRKVYNDISFLDAFLTPEFCWDQKIFTYEYSQKSGEFEIFSRQFKDIKQKLLFQLTNFGNPFIYVEDGNFQNRSELLLSHKHEGIDLKKDYALEVLKNMTAIWTRPVHLRTLQDDKMVLWSHDGQEFSEQEWNDE
jgi:stage V sporulation protein R